MSSRKGEASIKVWPCPLAGCSIGPGGVLVPTSNGHLQYVGMKFGIGTILVIVGLKDKFFRCWLMLSIVATLICPTQMIEQCPSMF